MIRTTAMAIFFATSFVANASQEAKIEADPAKGKVIADVQRLLHPSWQYTERLSCY